MYTFVDSDVYFYIYLYINKLFHKSKFFFIRDFMLQSKINIIRTFCQELTPIRCLASR